MAIATGEVVNVEQVSCATASAYDSSDAHRKEEQLPVSLECQVSYAVWRELFRLIAARPHAARAVGVPLLARR